MAVILIFLAAALAAGVNFCLRKNFEKQPSAKGYLAIYFVFSFLVSFLFRREFDTDSFSLLMMSSGMVAGTLNLLMMVLVARALQIGPSGLTFAFQNAGSIFPALFLYFLFGNAFGFQMDWKLVAGFFCLALGLFAAVLKPKASGSPNLQEASSFQSFPRWLFLALAVFTLQGLILSIFQWRPLLFEYGAEHHLLIPSNIQEKHDVWFAPGFFLVPALFQALIFFVSDKRWFTKNELVLGTAGGILNGGATFCLLWAARIASESFRPILFPFFAVGVIFLCSLWGKKIYGEAIPWLGLLLCMAGIIMGAL